jgi:hypothetical protein
MIRHLLIGSALALALASTVPASAGTFAAPLNSNLPIQTVGCAVGAHLGPLGACIIGTEDPAPVVVEHRAADVPLPPVRDESTTRTMTQDSNGCATKTIEQNDGMGNSAAKSQSNC